MFFFLSILLTLTTQAIGPSQDAVSEIHSLEEFQDLSFEPGGFIKLGESIKVLIDNRDRRRPKVHFINANFCKPSDDCTSGRPSYATSHFKFAHRTARVRGFVDLYGNDIIRFYNENYYTVTDQERKFYAARMQTYINEESHLKLILIRFIERDKIQGEMISKVVRLIRAKVHISGYTVAFASNSENQVFRDSQGQEIAPPRDIPFYKMADLRTSAPYIGLKEGRACGFIRHRVADASQLQPMDIPVFDSLPIDLPYVAATVSTVFQDVGSHVNLKADERGTPNAVVMTESGKQRLLAIPDGSPIQLSVNKDDFAVRLLSESETRACEKSYRDRFLGEWHSAGYQATRKVVELDQLCDGRSPSDCLEISRKYGGKVAGLAFLSMPEVVGMGSSLQRKFGYRLTPMGIAVPLAFYNSFISHNTRQEPNPSNDPEIRLANESRSRFQEELNQLIHGERDPLRPIEEKRRLIHAVQDFIMKGDIPSQDYQVIYEKVMQLKAKVDQIYPDVSLDGIKIRSSANVEDIEKFNGAGLHDSMSAKISLSDEDSVEASSFVCKFKSHERALKKKSRTLACAIKAVYASLWNYRAVQERTGRRFDHSSASMGLSIQPKYQFRRKDSTHTNEPIRIIANSVLITRVAGTDNVYGYRLSTQQANKLVTNPVDGTQAELAAMTFQATNFDQSLSRTVIQYAKPEASQPPLSEAVLSFERMRDQVLIAKEVEIAYCKAKKSLYAPNRSCRGVISSQAKPLALDMEFKIFGGADHPEEVLIKQVRQFWGR